MSLLRSEEKNMKKLILDLCGGTGAWSLPYKEAGYDVRNITLPDYDVTKVSLKDGRYFEFLTQTFGKPNLKIPVAEIYGILSAPPCTMFSFARTNAKTKRNLREGMEIVIACLRLIWEAQYRIKNDQQKYSPLKFWALENPFYGMLQWFLGKPTLTFQPYDFGHNYQKKTAIWGYFNTDGIYAQMSPNKLSAEEKKLASKNSQPLPKFDYMKSKTIAPEWFGKLDRQARRAITPRGFAEAFFKANK